MAANKFATMLLRNTNRITLILVYALLEWILIFFLLLNSLFSYLVIKYAEYFGLQKPCLWCSRIDHLIDSKKNKISYRDLVCDVHANEISRLGFCSNHQKLSESEYMCEDCSSSLPQLLECSEMSRDYASFPWMKKIGLIQGPGEVAVENGDLASKCSCCGVSVQRKFYSPCVLLKPSWDVLDYTQTENLIKESEQDDKTDEGDHFDFDFDCYQSRSDFVSSQLEEDEQKIEESRGDFIEGTELEAEDKSSVHVVVEKEQESINEEEVNVLANDTSYDQRETEVSCGKEASSPEIGTKHLEFYIDGDDCHLIPVELIDPVKPGNKNGCKFKEEYQGVCGNEDVILDFTMDEVATQVDQLVVESKPSSGDAASSASGHDNEDEIEAEDEEVNGSEWSPYLQAEDGEVKEEEEEERHEQGNMEFMTQNLKSNGDDDVQESSATEDMETDANQVYDDVLQMQCDELDAEVSIGTEIPDHEPIDDLHTQEEGAVTVSFELQADNYAQDPSNTEHALEFKAMETETCENRMDSHLSYASDLNDSEEDRVPNTPTSIDNKFFMFDRRESEMEESLDGGSVMSDIEVSGGVLTVENLKTALRAERKALNALYSELEEERSASAIAANQTMAMINRLQEEKAAMQMEASQYQRMMEEQSEYDQEALQLLNELMVKREREKAEVEKELEIYRKKVQDYELKEKIQMLRRRSRTSSASCSNAEEDSDGLSVELNHEVKEDESFSNNQATRSEQNTPADAVLYLDESLASFEDERISILEQLKVLEEKLFTLNDEDEQLVFEDIKSIDHLYQENSNGCYEDHDYNGEANGVASNGHFKEMNGKLHYHEVKNIGEKAKRLLPLFDAEAEDGALNGSHELDYDSVASQTSSVSKFELDNHKTLAIKEEVDHVYGRLQALEADREFLKHCISSLRKGDKGLYLLQEILQHLRDLRDVEMRARTSTADAVS